MKLKNNIYTVVTILVALSWLITTLIILIFSFSYLEIPGLEGLKLYILLGAAILSVGSIFLTGHFLDYNPQYLRILALVSFFISTLALILMTFLPKIIFGGVLGFLILSIGLGIATAAANIYFAAYTPDKQRARIYGFALTIFSLVGLVIIFMNGYLGYFDNQLLKLGIAAIALAGLVLIGIVLYYITKTVPCYENDEFPTKIKDILNRDSVQKYYISIFVLGGLVGIVAQNITLNFERNFDNRIITYLENVDLFWALVLVGIVVSALIAGNLADKFGRKKPGIGGIYGISLSLLLYATDITSIPRFMFAAILFGISISLILVTFTSTVLVDLSPRDAIGRYLAIGFSLLLLGIGGGYGVGRYVLTVFDVQTVAFLLIFVAFLSAFPLFFVVDTYPPLELRLLIICLSGGRLAFFHKFRGVESVKINLGLLAGALEAINNFMEETMQEDATLNLVKHGTNFIISDKDTGVSASIITNKPSNELQSRLKLFLEKFQQNYQGKLQDWTGSLSTFKSANTLVEKYFGPLEPITDNELNLDNYGS